MKSDDSEMMESEGDNLIHNPLTDSSLPAAGLRYMLRPVGLF
jgi:hypothetical protein